MEDCCSGSGTGQDDDRSKPAPTEVRILEDNFASLVKAISTFVTAVANRCLEEDLIHIDVHEHVVGIGSYNQPGEDEARALLLAVIDAVSVDCGRFKDVLSVFKETLQNDGERESTLYVGMSLAYERLVSIGEPQPKRPRIEAGASIGLADKETITPEEQTVLEFNTPLTAALSGRIEALADQCWKCGLITKEHYRSILTANDDNKSSCARILHFVRKSIKGNCSKFQSFLNALNVVFEPQLVSDMRNHYNELVPPESCVPDPHVDTDINAKERTESKIAAQDIISVFTPDLVVAISEVVNTVSDECLSEGLITRGLYKKLLHPNSGSANKARHLLVAVDDCIQTNPKTLKLFLNVLESTLPRLSAIVLVPKILGSTAGVKTGEDSCQVTVISTLVEKVEAAVTESVKAKIEKEKLECELAHTKEENKNLEAAKESLKNDLTEMARLKQKIVLCNMKITELKDDIRRKDEIIDKCDMTVKQHTSLSKAEQKEAKEKTKSLEEQLQKNHVSACEINLENNVLFSAKRSAEGQYEVNFTPAHPGRHEKVHGQHIKGSPFDVKWPVLDFGTPEISITDVRRPAGVAISDSGDMLVVVECDKHFARASIFDSQSGKKLGFFGSFGTGNGQFMMPRGVAFDDKKNILVTGYGDNKIHVFTANGAYLKQIPGPGILIDLNFNKPPLFCILQPCRNQN